MRSLFSSADIAPPHLVVVGECAGYSRVNVDAGPRLRRDSLAHEAGVSAREMFPLALDTKAVASARVAGTTASRRGRRTNPGQLAGSFCPASAGASRPRLHRRFAALSSGP